VSPPTFLYIHSRIFSRKSFLLRKTIYEINGFFCSW
jgi:hypothetical protein